MQFSTMATQNLIMIVSNFTDGQSKFQFGLPNPKSYFQLCSNKTWARKAWVRGSAAYRSVVDNGLLSGLLVLPTSHRSALASLQQHLLGWGEGKQEYYSPLLYRDCEPMQFHQNVRAPVGIAIRLSRISG